MSKEGPLLIRVVLLHTTMASAVPVEVVDWAYQETPPLNVCMSCKWVGKVKVIEDHMLAQNHEGPPSFQCVSCKRVFSWNQGAPSLDRSYSGKTLKEVIIGNPEVDVLASGAGPLSEGEANSHLHDQIARNMMKFPL